MNLRICKKQIMFFMVFFVLSMSSRAQSVIGTSNFLSSEKGVYLEWTIGEVLTKTLMDSDQFCLEQGFHHAHLICQPCGDEFELEDALAPFVPSQETDVHLSLFPNPVMDLLNVEVELPNQAGAFVAVYDATGQLLQLEKVTTGVSKFLRHTLNVSSMPTGQYYLKIFNSSFNQTKAFQIIN